MKNFLTIGFFILILASIPGSGTGQIIIPAKYMVNHFYNGLNTDVHNNPSDYYLRDITVYINSFGPTNAIEYPEYSGGNQNLGYATQAPTGTVWEVYSLTGMPTVQNKAMAAVFYPRTYTYQPDAADIGKPFKLTAMMVGITRNKGDAGSFAHDPVYINFAWITVEQHGFINQSSIKYLCNTDPVISLMDYFQGALDATFYLDDTGHSSSAIYQIDPSIIPAGKHTITAYKNYANGDFVQTVPIIIVAPSQITFNPYPSAICENGGIVNILAIPTGGSWAGTAIDNNGNFNPATAGIGTFVLTYSFINPNKAQNPNGCISTKVATISVVPLPNVNAGTDLTVCFNGGSQKLTGSPSGGIWSGAGVTGDYFDPKIAGIGNFPLQYTYTDNASGCTNSNKIQATVKPVTDIVVPADISVCINAPLVNLTALPAGGSWSGTGVENNSFSATKAGLGNKVLVYTYIDQTTGCSSNANFSITVLDIPVPVAPANFSICQNSSPILLQGANPIGGTYSGDGVLEGVFNPAKAGIGNHTLTYSYKDPNAGCIGYTSYIITVKPLPVISAGPGFEICQNAYPIQLNGQPGGGLWSGDGIFAGLFNPAIAGPGNHILTYTIQDLSIGCSNSDTLTVSVNSIPLVNAGNDTTICNNASAIQLQGSPAGGTWAGPGINGSRFVPSESNIGLNTLSYTFTNSTGCSVVGYKKITVLKTLTVSAGNALTLCVNSPIYDLNQDVSLQGGNWSGTGVNGGYFNSGKAGTGVFNLVYAYLNQAGCISTSTRTVSVLGIPGRVIITGNSSGCNGDIVQLFAQADSATNYVWYHQNEINPFATGSQVNVTVTKTELIYCVGINALSCGLPKLNSNYITIKSLTPTATLLSSQTSIPFGGLVHFTTGNNYNVQNFQWNFGDGAISTNQNPSHYYYSKGSFKVHVILTSPENCTDSLSLQNNILVGSDDSIAILQPPPRLVSEDQSQFDVKIFPTPFKDHIYLTFHLSHPQLVALKIYDTFGRLIKIEQYEGKTGNNKFTLANLGALVIKNYYLVILRSEELNELIKVLKM